MSDSEFNPSPPATITYRDSMGPLYHNPDLDLHPAPENKRKEMPPTTTAETTVVTKRIKVDGSSSHGCVRTADFNELAWSVIEKTISIYRAQIGSVEPFPECADDCDTVKQAWLEVCTGRNLQVELEDDYLRIYLN